MLSLMLRGLVKVYVEMKLKVLFDFEKLEEIKIARDYELQR